MINIIEKRDQKTAREQCQEKQRPVRAVAVKRQREQRQRCRAVEPDLAQRLSAEPIFQQQRTHTSGGDIAIFKSPEQAARQQKKNRTENLDQVKPEKNLEVITRRGGATRALSAIVVLRALERQAVQFMVQ